MYFIRTGEFEVTIKSSFHDQNLASNGPKVRKLFDGDHFGEIGLIFNTNRTANVKSLNYGSLAMLTQGGFK